MAKQVSDFQKPKYAAVTKPTPEMKQKARRAQL
jgi:hypothetical protein